MPYASALPPSSLLVVLALPANDHIPLRRASTLLTNKPLLNQQLQIVLGSAHGNIFARQGLIFLTADTASGGYGRPRVHDAAIEFFCRVESMQQVALLDDWVR